ncbi:hypothetical protein [Nonomuraea sp. NPDC003804]|uniref:hypothetical protein n=1 Tax=Nonomuraea sp. NPDC003804 TaxID=3154547 RepID=UPI0033AF40DE
MMCSTTGRGAAKNRPFSGVIAAPPASSVRRTAPATTGTAPSTISAVGTSHPALEDGAVASLRPSFNRPARGGCGDGRRPAGLSSVMPSIVTAEATAGHRQNGPA